jgi:putative peptidoglycan lipid II flippase
VLRAKLGGLNLWPLVARYGLFALAALPASATGVGILIAFGGSDGAGYLEESALWSALVMLVITLTMVVVYGLVLLVLRNTEVRDVLQPVVRRLGLSKRGNTSS